VAGGYISEATDTISSRPAFSSWANFEVRESSPNWEVLMSSTARITLFVLSLAALATPLAAQHRVVKGPRGNVHVVHPRRRLLFRSNDRVLFRNYYRTHRIVITPLRPELVRLVVVGKPLPLEVVRVAVPPALVLQLAPPPVGYQYVIVGDRVVILDDEGNVSDILLGVFEPTG
jgi:hypothetical protein